MSTSTNYYLGGGIPNIPTPESSLFFSADIRSLNLVCIDICSSIGSIASSAFPVMLLCANALHKSKLLISFHLEESAFDVWQGTSKGGGGTGGCLVPLRPCLRTLGSIRIQWQQIELKTHSNFDWSGQAKLLSIQTTARWINWHISLA